eukprot:scaffold1546_cov121-Skeletonema_marinoi.AAC.1
MPMTSFPLIFSGKATKLVIGKVLNTRRASFSFFGQTPRCSISNLAMEQPVDVDATRHGKKRKLCRADEV